MSTSVAAMSLSLTAFCDSFGCGAEVGACAGAALVLVMLGMADELAEAATCHSLVLVGSGKWFHDTLAKVSFGKAASADMISCKAVGSSRGPITKIMPARKSRVKVRSPGTQWRQQ